MSPVPVPTRLAGSAVDLADRISRSATVAASPALAAETTVCTVTVAGYPPTGLGVILFGFAAFTVGASGVSVNAKLRKTDTSGTTLKATGAVTFTAGNLGSLSILGVDTSPSLPGQVYVLTLTVASGAAESTVSAVELIALAI